MRVIKSGETERTCGKCTSVIAMYPHEIHVVGPPGPYDMDYEPSETGKRYWSCPVCHAINWLDKDTGITDDTY